MSNQRVVQDLYGAFDSKDETRLRELLAPDVEWVQCAGFPGGGRRHGVEEVLENVFASLRTEWQDWRVQVDEYLDAGPSVVALGRYSGTHGVTGHSMEAVFAHVYDVESERVTRFRQFTDTVPLVEAAHKTEASATQASAVPAVPRDETFDGTWPFEARYTKAPGFRMHYVDEGEGETVLALHGEPTWGYLFRNLIKALSPRYRVVVPDHMGFGKSETPHDRTYLLQDHIDNLERFVLGLDLRDITLVMHDFGGPAGTGLAIRHPGRIKRVISTNGPTPLGQPGLGDALAKNAAASPWFRWVAKAYADGTLEQVLGQLDYNILSTLKLNGFERNDVVTNTWLRAYSGPFKAPEYCLGAIGWAKGFAEGAHRFEPADALTARALSRKPALAIWGMADRTLQPEHFIPLFSEAFPNGTVHRLEGVGHYSHEDAPEEVAKRVDEFLQKT